MRQSKINFPSSILKLEGLCYYPEGKGPFPAVALCHPHPLHGGSMESDVIMTAASALADEGIVALMFNFRGVGGSQGEFDNGSGEQEDVKAAVSWMASQKEVDKTRLGLAGYSFGGVVGLAEACNDDRVKGLALISPALQPPEYECLQKLNTPKLLIVGTEDHLISPEQAEQMFGTASEPKQFHLIPSADHFWCGHTKVVAGKVTDFFSGLFNPAI